MKRSTMLCLLLTALSGCVSTGDGSRPADNSMGVYGPTGSGMAPPSVPGVQGPWGTPVPMVGPYSAHPPAGSDLARQMMANSVPLDLVQQQGGAGSSSGIMQAGGVSMPGMPPGVMRAGGMMPSNPGMMAAGPSGIMPVSDHREVLPVPAIPGAVAAVGGPLPPGPAATRRTEVRFAAPAGMKVAWYGYGPDGRPGFAGNQIEVPGRYNFVQGAIYRLKLSDIPNRPGVDLYPTLEVVPSNYKTDAFIAHSAVPVFFSDEDFDQVASGNFLVKVIYLPFPQYQDIATGGPDEIVSTRLEPGLDPIQEACKRGNILLVVRLGNIDLEAPNTPAMDAPGPGDMGGMGGPGMCMLPGRPLMPGMPGMPMMAGPGMPMMAGPGRPMMMPGGPMMIPGGPLPPGAMPPGAKPAVTPVKQGPPLQAPPGPGVPVTKLPDYSPIQPVQHSAPTPAQLASQGQ